MQKHAVLFTVALFAIGAVLAQGVAITQPLDGLVTSDANQRVTYVFADPLNVDDASVVLNVDGTDYTTASPEITWTLVNFHYDVDPAWTEGAHVCSLWSADDTLGTSIVGIPLVTDFSVDLSGPYLNARTPGVVGEANPIVTTNILEPITIDILDDWGFINTSTIQVRIDGVVYDETSLGVTITPIAGGYQFGFDPATAGIAWDENDWILVELLAAEDSPDYGMPNELLDSPDNVFGFFVDADGPECYPVDPIPQWVPTAFLGCSDYELTWRIEDENGIDLTSFSIQINSWTYNWGNFRLTTDTLAMVGTDVTEVLFTFTPNPPWYNGVMFTVHPPVVNDIYGNPATGWHWGNYPWIDWNIKFDGTGPSISNPFPPALYVTRDFQQPISFDITDVFGKVDPMTIHFTIEAGATFIEYTDWHPFFKPEITWDGTRMTFYPADIGVTWNQGDTVSVTVWNVKDSMEFCTANDAENTPYNWRFYVADGPMVGAVVPDNNSFTSCPTQQISFTLLDPDGIDPNTVLFAAEGFVFDITYEVVHVDTIVIGPGTLFVPDTVNPFYEDPFNPGTFILDVALLPPGIVDYTDAMEVNCSILEARDMLGNTMWGGPYDWRFWVDFSGPFVGSVDPAIGSVASGPNPTVVVEIFDNICGAIDPFGVLIKVGAVTYHPPGNPAVEWEDIPGGARVTIHTTTPFAHGEVVTGRVSSAYDKADYRCSAHGNEATGLPYLFDFKVDNYPPVPTIVSPQIGEITACPREPIVVEVTDEYGVDPNHFQMVVNDVVYNWGDPRLAWDGTYLTYTPTADYPEGTVTWSLTKVGDLAGKIDDTSPIAGATFLADYTAPAVLWTEPAQDEMITTVPTHVKLGIDDPAGVDINQTQFTFDVYTGPVTFTTTIVDEATFPGVFTWDPVLGELWVDLDVAGLAFDHQLYQVVVTVDMTDNPDYACPDNNALLGYTFDFGMYPGWEVQMEYYPDGAVTPDDIFHFGAYVGCTDEYDVGIDEEAPPLPPPPAEAPLAFITPGSARLIKDYRGIEENLSWTWQMNTGGSSGCLRWDPAALPEFGSFVMVVAGGEIDMRGNTEYCFGPDEIIEINVTREIMVLYPGWNLISVPVIPVDPAIAAVFPMVDPNNIWEFVGPGYIHPTFVMAGHAYFVLYQGVEPLYFDIPGARLTEYNRTIGAGWQTLGSVYDFGGVPIASVVDNPSGSIEDICFGLDAATGAYYASDVIVAGLGYWNFVDPPGPLTSCEIFVENTYVRRKALPGITERPDWTATLTFTDEVSRDITIGELDIATTDYDRGLDMPIPPALPGAVFDVYIEAGRCGRMVKDIRDGDGWTIVVNADNAVELSWSCPEDLVLVGNGTEIAIRGEGSTVIEPGVYTAKRRVEVPRELALLGAAPNPFNAACAISFDVAERTEVSIDVFDMMGRRVTTLVDAEIEPGTHKVVWNGTDETGRDVSSGVYLYRMVARDFRATGRMVLLR